MMMIIISKLIFSIDLAPQLLQQQKKKRLSKKTNKLFLYLKYRYVSEEVTNVVLNAIFMYTKATAPKVELYMTRQPL